MSQRKTQKFQFAASPQWFVLSGTPQRCACMDAYNPKSGILFGVRKVFS